MNIIGLISVLLIIALVCFLFLFFRKEKYIKTCATFLTIIAVIGTGMIICEKPKLHAPVSMSVIDYLIKFNDDGSVITTKKTTRTNYKNKEMK
ncbi:MAG: hypothetical protein PHV37_07880 [Candidatus Gastranaerophilales bacterium]|nr:hypothetical protein [Candidatus Gastranaerophilales bacterium]